MYILRSLYAAAFCLLVAPSLGKQVQQPLAAAPSSSSASTQDIASIAATAANHSALFDLHKLLINTESVSGNEHTVGLLLAAYLRAQNFTVELQPVAADDDDDDSKILRDDSERNGNSNSSDNTRYNVFAYRGSSRKTPVLVTSHIDTVPPFYPYELRGTSDIWGRGSVDAKGCVAAQITALLSLLAAGSVEADDVALLFVVGEEVDGVGMTTANGLGLGWDAVIFGEPTELKLAAGHKGAMLLRVTARGQAAHSGYPWLGESAISMLLPALVAVQREPLPRSDKYGNTTLNIGTLRGGVAPNVVAETARAELQIRLAAGEPAALRRQLTDALLAVDERLELEFWLGYGPVGCDTDIDGFDTITVNYGTDVPHLKGDHKRYLYGPGSILVAHSDHEHLEAADLVEAVDGYKRLILGALGKS